MKSLLCSLAYAKYSIIELLQGAQSRGGKHAVVTSGEGGGTSYNTFGCEK